TAKTGLSLHPDKTRIVDHEAGQGFEFLGHVFAKGRVRPRQKSILNLRAKIRDKTPRKSGKSLQAVIADLNPVLRGWFGFFRDCPSSSFEPLDKFARRRLRAMLDTRLGKQACFKG